LGVCFTAAVVRYLLVGLAGSGHPLQALASTVGSAGCLVAYPWAAHQTVAMVNTLTNAILSFQIVGDGLQRTAGIMFGGALLVGSGGVFLAVLVIVGVVFVAVMFCMKVLVLLAFALLYVVGPLVIAVRPLPELSHLVRAWGTVLVGVALVPLGWTILFATAGALSLDATSFGAVGQSELVSALTAHVAGAFAALLTFYLAVKLPLGVLGHLRGALGPIGGPARTGGAPRAGGGGGGATRVSDANARLRAGTLQAGHTGSGSACRTAGSGGCSPARPVRKGSGSALRPRAGCSPTARRRCVKLLHVPPKVAVSAGVFVIGLPATLAYLSEGDGLGLGRLIRDAAKWTCSAHMRRRAGSVGELLGLAAIGEDGLAIAADGTYLC
jgi:hypothetical protein